MIIRLTIHKYRNCADETCEKITVSSPVTESAITSFPNKYPTARKKPSGIGKRYCRESLNEIYGMPTIHKTTKQEDAFRLVRTAAKQIKAARKAAPNIRKNAKIQNACPKLME